MRWPRVLVAALLLLGCDDPPAGSSPDTPPPPPRVLDAYRLTGGAVALAWEAVPGAFRHEVERTSDATGEVVTFGDLAASARSLVDSTTLPGALYTYRVRAANGAGTGAPAVLGVETAPAGPETRVVPDALTLGVNGKQAFSVMVNGSPNVPVTWVVLEGAYGGMVSGTGTYRAPLRTGQFHLVAIAPDTVAGMATIDVR